MKIQSLFSIVIAMLPAVAIGRLGGAGDIGAIAPCPQVLCADPCPEGRCDSDEMCVTKDGPPFDWFGQKCSTCPVFLKCSKHKVYGTPCGHNHCTGKRSVCCNASCGTCVEPGTYCLQIACDAHY
uniref:TNFR-Cys domain-containing protein n=1 Tax=Grammatophora oceanica TaxID=210454 RepID=A0A7S1V1B0_9STRA